MRIRSLVSILVVCEVAAGLTADVAGSKVESNVTISDAEKDENGFLVHSVASAYQHGATEIRVLLPDRIEEGRQYPVLFLLPVEARNSERWGNALSEVKRTNLHNQHRLIVVYPTFSHLPWYCDHPTDSSIRQETYLVKVVVPFIESAYPTLNQRRGRFVVGFSKSGWGAFSLLLRHPELFGRAAAWDAPLMMDQPNNYGMGPIFGDQENFEKYRIASLLKERADLLQQDTRLALLGYGNFREHHQQAHALMKQFGIRHVYRDGPKRRHHWSSGWLTEAVALLVEKAERNQVGGVHVLEIVMMMGAKARAGPDQLAMYRRIFGFIDANSDGKLSLMEFVEDGRYLTREARAGIFRASDRNGDDLVSESEYVENRTITDDARAIFQKMDTDTDGRLTQNEFIDNTPLKDAELSAAVFVALDTDGDKMLTIPEFFRVWGDWARAKQNSRL